MFLCALWPQMPIVWRLFSVGVGRHSVVIVPGMFCDILLDATQLQSIRTEQDRVWTATEGTRCLKKMGCFQQIGENFSPNFWMIKNPWSFPYETKSMGPLGVQHPQWSPAIKAESFDWVLLCRSRFCEHARFLFQATRKMVRLGDCLWTGFIRILLFGIRSLFLEVRVLEKNHTSKVMGYPGYTILLRFI